MADTQSYQQRASDQQLPAPQTVIVGVALLALAGVALLGLENNGWRVAVGADRSSGRGCSLPHQFRIYRRMAPHRHRAKRAGTACSIPAYRTGLLDKFPTPAIRIEHRFAYRRLCVSIRCRSSSRCHHVWPRHAARRWVRLWNSVHRWRRVFAHGHNACLLHSGQRDRNSTYYVLEFSSSITGGFTAARFWGGPGTAHHTYTAQRSCDILGVYREKNNGVSWRSPAGQSQFGEVNGAMFWVR